MLRCQANIDKGEYCNKCTCIFGKKARMMRTSTRGEIPKLYNRPRIKVIWARSPPRNSFNRNYADDSKSAIVGKDGAKSNCGDSVQTRGIEDFGGNHGATGDEDEAGI